MQPKIKVGIIGFGKAGEGIHYQIISKMPQFAVTAVVSSKISTINATFPDLKVFPNIDEFLTQSDAKLVIIATPTHLHYLHAKMCLEAHKHVVIDKPFVVHEKEGIELIKLAKAKQLILSVFQNKRWNNEFIFLRNLIKENKIGSIYELYLNFDYYCPEIEINNWRETEDLEGNGRLYDLGSHTIDQALTLFGLPDKIDAKIAKSRINAKAIDNFDLIFYYHNLSQQTPLKVYLGCSYTNPILRPNLIAVGEKAIFTTEGLDARKIIINKTAPKKIKINSKEATLIDKLTGTIEHFTLSENPYENYYANIYAAIKNSAPLPVSAEQSLEVVKIIEKVTATNKS